MNAWAAHAQQGRCQEYLEESWGGVLTPGTTGNSCDCRLQAPGAGPGPADVDVISVNGSSRPNSSSQGDA
jgi:hypothetical protein